MTREYAPLTLSPLARPARLPDSPPLDRVSLDDPAISVMTDLAQVSPAAIGPERTINEANAKMLDRGVRLLFVVDGTRAVVGVITATDLLGEQPMRFAQERGVKRGDILVADLMTPAATLEALAFSEVAQMRVGHVVATMRAVHRQHVLVAEDGGRRVRGVFSATRIARQLGVDVSTPEVAQTFAEIEAALAR